MHKRLSEDIVKLLKSRYDFNKYEPPEVYLNQARLISERDYENFIDDLLIDESCLSNYYFLIGDNLLK